jgi:hypothetical protein
MPADGLEHIFDLFTKKKIHPKKFMQQPPAIPRDGRIFFLLVHQILLNSFSSWQNI